MPAPRIKYAWRGVLERIGEIGNCPVTECDLHIVPSAKGHELAEKAPRVTKSIGRILPPEQALGKQ
jgi:hypothetical protein